VPSSAQVLRPHPRLQHSAAADAAWDDQTEREARGLVALLFVAGGSLRRADLAAALRVSAGRVTPVVERTSRGRFIDRIPSPGCSIGFRKRFGPASVGTPGQGLQGLALAPGVPRLNGDRHKCLAP